MKNILLGIGVLLLTACSSSDDLPALRLGVRHFASCGQIQSYVRRVQENYNAAMADDDSYDRVALSGQADSTSSESFVNLQEESVDEADFFRVSPYHLLYAGAKAIEVVTRSNLNHLGAVSTSGLRDVRLYTDGKKLIVLGKIDSETRVAVYAAAQGNTLPVLKSERTFPGQVTESRYISGRLVLIIPDAIDEESFEGNEHKGIRCTSYSIPPVEDTDLRVTKILSIDTDNLEVQPKEVAVTGIAEHLYMTADAIYVTKTGIWWPVGHQEWDKSVVAKVSFSAQSGEIKLEANGVVSGYAKDRWAFKEYASHNALAVATTTFGEANHLTVLQQRGDRLEAAGSVEGFGHNEDIRAIRYVGNMAYVVTFEKTDPLFAIDMSNPLSPQMRGDLIVPGFSVYLHPVATGRLVGLGFDAIDAGAFSWAQGIQLSLFDTEDPVQLKRLDHRVFGERGSSSEATRDAHAFFYDPANKLLAFPLNEIGDATPKFSGAVLYSTGNSLTEIARFTHSRWVPSNCEREGTFWAYSSRAMNINRVAKIDGKLLSVSQFGILVHSLTNPRLEIGSVPFNPTETFCGAKSASRW